MPEDGENADVTLPKLSEGQGFPNPAAKVTEHTTTPPKPPSEASLLSAMERAGNGDTDPAAERRGLGTPATRAAVIEKLVKGGFAERKGKHSVPSNSRKLILSSSTNWRKPTSFYKVLSIPAVSRWMIKWWNGSSVIL